MKMVIALGGNALTPSKKKVEYSDLAHNIKQACRYIANIINSKNQVVIVFGSGPQIGALILQNEIAKNNVSPMPLDVLDAELQGELGYIVEQSLMNLLSRHRIKKPVVSVLTQVVVDRKDPAFHNPTKPVGPFYTKAEASNMKKKGLAVAFETGRGWRRVVPSPRPKRIVEAGVIRGMSRHAVVIAAGGGGIPVVETKRGYRGVDAVIDKDLASACLAISMKADILLILTDVPCAYINFLEKNQKPIKHINTKGHFHAGNEEGCISSGFFGAGSMLPKIQAGLWFARNGGTAVITNPASAAKALSGKAGTIIGR